MNTPVPRTNQEAWQNVVQGTVVVAKFNHRGEMVSDEVVPPGKTFHITTEERVINQTERCADPDLDPFTNGMLRPVRLLDSSEEAEALKSNPNVMSDSDMMAMLKSHHKTFSSKLEKIKNPYALERLLALATQVDSDIAFSRVQAVKDRLTAFSPKVTEVTVASSGPERSVGRPAV